MEKLTKFIEDMEDLIAQINASRKLPENERGLANELVRLKLVGLVHEAGIHRHDLVEACMKMFPDPFWGQPFDDLNESRNEPLT